jgi:hypothetical protein
MSEVLEDLAFIKEKFAYLEYNSETFNIPKKELCNIEEALKRLEAIDNAEPSEALECLERIDNTLCLNNIKGKLDFGIDTEEHTDCDSVIGMTEDLESIKQALLKAQEQEKAIAQFKEIVSLDYLCRVFGYPLGKQIKEYFMSNELLKQVIERVEE